jgi:hypothetical protein
MSTNLLWSALLATPSVLGITLAASMTSSLAQSQQPPEQSLVEAQAISTGLDQPPSLSPQTDSSEGKQAPLAASSIVTQTSVSPLVSAVVILAVPGSQSTSLQSQDRRVHP